MIHHPKYDRLAVYLKELGGAVVAFSGGVDSTFLLYAAREALGDHMAGLTVRSPYIANWEVDEAITIAKELDIPHRVVEAGIPDEIRDNPENRCYLCKRKIFTTLLEIARSEGFDYVLDGTNHDDPSDHRPGLAALQELGVISPLMVMGITKSEVRQWSRIIGLPTWDKPSYACLLTRLPHGVTVDPGELRRIEQAEKFLMDLGYREIRVRSHGDLARIEVTPGMLGEFTRPDLSRKIVQEFHKIGYRYITLDLQGYRTGSFNPIP